MIRTYRYVSHSMEKMQEFIDYIFLEVWCRAPEGLVFGRELFAGNSELHDVISSFGFSQKAPERGKQFYEDIKDIYVVFSSLTPAEIQQLKDWYAANNEIESICENQNSGFIRYPDLDSANSDLSEKLKHFFTGLYSRHLLGLVKLREKIGSIEEHYNQLMEANNRPSKCPFCGLVDILSNHSKREAYDHYLPKAIYPFNSINFRNLAPTCYYCNSSYKGPVDPVGEDTPNKVFYPYKATSSQIAITVDLSLNSEAKITKENVSLSYGPDSLQSEITSWREIYGIDERYQVKCSGADAKDWMEQSRILKDKRKLSISDQIEDLREATGEDALANSNFLKLAFLEGCQRSDLI